MIEKKISISEAAKQLSLESHVLRYWEMELGLQISRNNQGHRFYKPEDIALLRDIKDLKEQGFQLKAIKLLLPDIHNVREMSPQRLYELREELNERVQGEDILGNKEEHTAQIMPLHPKNSSEISYNYHNKNSNYQNNAEEKLRHFEAMMRKMIRTTVAEMGQETEERIYERITTKLLKEMDYLTRQREELHEKQVALLKEILAQVRHELPEAATSQETPILQSRKKDRNKKPRKKIFSKQK